jgi:LuxR family maltose regulon positive regulatory protein
MSLDLSATDVSTLETRTEGWIAGLKLAALSLQNHGDVQTFVHAFSGGNRYIGDYLIQEVLRAQSPGIREFLLDTAILDRLSGPLCDALTGERDSQARLESLERSNLFVVPLDDTRTCYRYHHLFAEVLRAHSLREDPDRVRTMHRRASAWFEERAAHAEALHHAAAANDPERVARLLELRWPALDKSYQTSRWLERVTALPDAMIRVRPVLSMGYAWALLNVGELELVADRLDDVEQWLRIADSGDSATDRAAQMIVVDESRWRILNVELASARVYLAQALGEVGGTAEHARRLLQLIPEGDHSARARASALLGLSLWSTGDLEDAYGAFTAALAHMRSAGGDFDAIRGTFVPADIRVAQGRLHEAEKIYSSGLRLAKDATLTAVPQTDELYLGLSELHRERNELEAAREVLRSITEARDRTDYAGNRLRWCTAMSRIAEARGDLDAALDLLVEAEGVDVRSPVPRVRPLPAIRARLWILQGKMVEAERWAKESGLSADDELSYLREFEHITLVRLLIARHRAHKREAALPDALALIERLLMAASRGGRKGSVIEVLVLEAVTLHARNDTRAALDPLERALALAEPEGYVRVFVDEGEPMRDLLRHAAARGTGGSYTRHVLAHFDGAAESGAPRPRLATTVPEPTGERLLQALTARELEILRLIAVGLRNQEIADQLSISTATVKRHVANAYAKLGVSHRTEALVRAHALNLL